MLLGTPGFQASVLLENNPLVAHFLTPVLLVGLCLLGGIP